MSRCCNFRSFVELLFVLLTTLAFYFISVSWDVFEAASTWIRRHEAWQLDGLLLTSLFAAVGLILFSFRRWREASLEAHERRKAEESLQRAYGEIDEQIRERTAELASANERLVREVESRKAAEQALQESEARVQDILNKAPSVIYVKDKHGRYTFVNCHFERLSGHRREGILGRTDFDLFPHEVAQQSTHNDQSVLTTGCLLETEEVAPVAGEMHTFISAKFPLSDMTGAVCAICGISTDINERKRTEMALRESEERYRSLFEMESDAIFLIDNETGQLLEVNPACSLLYGYSREELLQMTHTDLSAEPAETRKATRETRRVVLLRYHRKKSGEVFPVEITARHFSWQGRAVHIAAIRDISERIEAQEEIEQQRAFLREVIDRIPNPIYAEARDGRIVLANRAMAATLGLTPEEVVGRSVLEAIPDKELAQRMHQEDMALLSGGGDGIEREEKQIDSLGIVHWYYTNKIPLRDEQGLVRQLISVSTDITGRRQAEEELRQKEEQLRSIVEHSNQLFYSHTVDHVLTYVSPQARDFLGCEPREAMVRWTEFITDHPLNSQGFERTQRAIETGVRQPAFPLELVGRDGRAIWVEVNESPVVRDGRTVAIVGALTDISDRRRAEEALKESEEKFSKAFYHAPVLMTLSDLSDGTYIEVNDRFLHASGFSREEAVGRTSTELGWISIDDRVRLVDALRTHGRVEGMELRLVAKDQSVVHCLYNGEVITVDGRPRLLSIASDISERKRIENALMESEEKYRSVVDNLGIGVTVVSPEMEVLALNPRMRSWYPGISVSSKPTCYRVFNDPPRQDVCSYCPARETFRDGKVHECVTDTPAGTDIKHFRVVASPIKDGDGQVVSVVELVEDVTERKQAEKETKRLETQLRQAQKIEALGTLAGGIAHDFNNILAAIVGYTDMALLEAPESGPIRQDLDQIYNASQRARDLVRQILAYSRHSHVQERVSVDINPIVEEAVKFIRATLPSTVEICWGLPDNPSVAQADSTQIHQVLINLSTNAAHAMSEGGGVLDIRLEPVDLGPGTVAGDLKPGRYLRLSVSDTGHGMNKETVERIFDPYFTTKDVGKGSGLGLAVVHGIVKRHEGAITVHSELGSGSRFEVYLPRMESPGVDRSVAASEMNPLPRGTGRILYVDDEELLVTLGTKMLESLGYSPLGVTSSLEALEIFRSAPYDFDLVITDYTMPKMAGDVLVQEILKIRPDLPVLLASGFSEKMTEEKAREMGVKEFVMKPLSLRDLAEAVRRALHREVPDAL